MLEIAVAYTFVAWLSGWWIDLLFAVVRGPLFLDPIVKLVVVTLCLVMIVVALWRHHWLLGG
jgi:hypothetical protein